MAETGTAAAAAPPIEAHRRGPWSQAEDQRLIVLVHEHGGLNWVRISLSLGSRSPKQCRERYHQNLKPTLNHEPITPAEGARIEQLVRELGKRWAEIARHLPGRSDNAVKNWWNGSQNRRTRQQRRHQSRNEPVDYHHGSNSIRGAPHSLPPSNVLPSPTVHHPYPAHWSDARPAPLPSPSLSASPNLNNYGNYTTSPTGARALPRGQLPLPPPMPVPRAMPRAQEVPGDYFLPPLQCSSNRAHQREHLLTAPSSPTSQQMASNQQQQASDQQRTASGQPKHVGKKNSRISVSSLLH